MGEGWPGLQWEGGDGRMGWSVGWLVVVGRRGVVVRAEACLEHPEVERLRVEQPRAKEQREHNHPHRPGGEEVVAGQLSDQT